MSKVWLLAQNDLRLTLRDRPAFLWMVAMPIAMMWFFGGLGADGAGPPKISLSIVNHDDGWLSAALIEELTDESIELRQTDPSQPVVAERRARTLVIPEGFTAGALFGNQQTLRLEQPAAADAEYGVAAQVHVVRAIVRTLGRLVEMRDGGAPGAAAAGGPVALERFRSLGTRADLVTLSVGTAGSGRAVPSGRAQSVPGVLTFIVMMMTLIYGAVFLTIEKSSGMLLRQAVLPMSRRGIFLGKLVGRLLLAAIQIVLLVLVGRFVFGVSWGDSPLGLALLLASYSVAVGALSTLFGAVLRTPAQASSVGWIASMVMAALGGCWWPSELMPGWMQRVAHGLPTAWAMDGFHALISFGRGLEGVILPSLVLLGFGLAFTLLGERLLRFER